MVLNIHNMITARNIQGDVWGKVNILEGDNIGHYGLNKRFTWTWVYFWTVTETDVRESPDLTPFDLFFCVVGWTAKFTKRKKNVDIRDKLLVRIPPPQQPILSPPNILTFSHESVPT